MMIAAPARITPEPSPRANASDGTTSLFSSPDWREVLAGAYGLTFDRAVCQSGGRDQIIHFSRIDDLKGPRIVSLPFSDYCDPHVTDFTAWHRLAGALMAQEVPVTLRCLHNDLPRQDPRLTEVGKGLWHAVDLTRPEAEIWASLGGSARQNVRKAQRAGVTVRADRTAEGVRIFHRLHAHLRRTKYRMLAQPTAFFQPLHEVFSRDDRIVTLLAEVDGVPVAGILFLQWGDTLYYKFNASTDTGHCPNDLLAWEGIRLGLDRGLARLDFGMSDLDQPGLIRYKRKYASQEGTISLLRWRPPGWRNDRAEEAGRLFSTMTRLLTDPGVPDDIGQAAGDALYRYFC